MNQTNGRQASVNLSNSKTYDPQTNTTCHRGARKITITKRDNAPHRPTNSFNDSDNDSTNNNSGNVVARKILTQVTL